ncbi:MAG: heavy metal translocating P-type ATPase [Allorhizobium sp.]
MNTLPSIASINTYGRPMLAVFALITLVAGLCDQWIFGSGWAHPFWFAGTAAVLAALVVEIVGSMMHGRFGLDIVAGLSMAAALAFDEPLAGNIVALMYAGGQQLENFAEGQARREMTALLGRVARTAMRYAGETLEEVGIETLKPGEKILIRHGEVVPVDGVLDAPAASLDLSALTGEPMPVAVSRGEEVPSGGMSVGVAFDLTVNRPAAESTYANIVRLVEGAQDSKAPMVRIADRYAIWFLLATVLLAACAWWFSGDRLRALAVLVVATPCPLILAVPVAVISGMSRAAALGVLVKSGGALEMLAQVRTVILDKTGTVTGGRAGVVEIRMAGNIGEDELLRLAASLDQASSHVIAEALVLAAHGRDLVLSNPVDVVENPGTGLEGMVDGRRVVVGGSDFVASRCTSGNPHDLAGTLTPGTSVVAVGVDGALAGIILLSDQIRSDAKATIAAFRKAGINRLVLASGDQAGAAQNIGAALGMDAVHGEVSPSGKVDIVLEERKSAHVMMIGDGVNDAPALAAADLGVAMGARGAAASSEAADIVLLVDHLSRLVGALSVASRTRTIALQSVFAGIGLSLIAMGFAAIGLLPPVTGALVQEAIDVAVILNALRALGGPKLESEAA